MHPDVRGLRSVPGPSTSTRIFPSWRWEMLSDHVFVWLRRYVVVLLYLRLSFFRLLYVNTRHFVSHFPGFFFSYLCIAFVLFEDSIPLIPSWYQYHNHRSWSTWTWYSMACFRLICGIDRRRDDQDRCCHHWSKSGWWRKRGLSSIHMWYLRVAFTALTEVLPRICLLVRFGGGDGGSAGGLSSLS